MFEIIYAIYIDDILESIETDQLTLTETLNDYYEKDDSLDLKVVIYKKVDKYE